MKLAVGVLTSERRKSYFDSTMTSLQQAGFSRKDIIVVADGPIRSLFSADCQWLVCSGSPYRGYMRALGALLSTDANALLLLEDDVVVAKNLAAYLRDTLWPAPETQILGVSLYTAESFERKYGKGKQGFQWASELEVDPKRDALGVCAMAYTRWGAASVLQHLGTKDRRDGQGGEIVKLLKAMAGPIALDCHWWFHVPSLAQHIGQVSTFHDFGNNADRQASDNWIRDCCTLLKDEA